MSHQPFLVGIKGVGDVSHFLKSEVGPGQSGELTGHLCLEPGTLTVSFALQDNREGPRVCEMAEGNRAVTQMVRPPLVPVWCCQALLDLWISEGALMLTLHLSGCSWWLL